LNWQPALSEISAAVIIQLIGRELRHSAEHLVPLLANTESSIKRKKLTIHLHFSLASKHNFNEQSWHATLQYHLYSNKQLKSMQQ
jgi:hypothetical protein